MKKISQTILFIYSILATLFLVHLFYETHDSTRVFDKIQAQQIRIVEPDGTLRMVISNKKKMPGVIIKGKEAEKIDRPQAGMLFYNDEGSETGGLIFSGKKNDKGQVVNSGVSLSFDRYGGKEEVNLIGVHDKDNKFAGLLVSDSKPGKKRTPSRIWVGRNNDGSCELALMDTSGKKRIVLKVSENGKSSLNFFDDKGNIVKSLSPVQKKN